jgi:hypothetical protein
MRESLNHSCRCSRCHMKGRANIQRMMAPRTTQCRVASPALTSRPSCSSNRSRPVLLSKASRVDYSPQFSTIMSSVARRHMVHPQTYHYLPICACMVLSSALQRSSSTEPSTTTCHPAARTRTMLRMRPTLQRQQLHLLMRHSPAAAPMTKTSASGGADGALQNFLDWCI